MQQRTVVLKETDATRDGRMVEMGVETVRPHEHVAEAALDGMPPAQVASRSRIGYFETLPERLNAVGFVFRAAVELLLGLRFLLLASGANRSSDFARFVEGVSWLFAWPFANVFSSYSLGAGIIEPSTLVAMAVYFVAFVLLGRLVTALTPRLHGIADDGLPIAVSPSIDAALVLPVESRRYTRILAPIDGVRRRRRSRQGRNRKLSIK